MNSTPSKSKSKATTVSQSKRAGLQFPVGRVKQSLKEGKYAERISDTASVYLAAVLQFMAAEVLQLSGNEAQRKGKNRIVPQHINLATRNDAELGHLLNNVTIPSSGMEVNFHQDRLPKSTGKKDRDIGSGSK